MGQRPLGRRPDSTTDGACRPAYPPTDCLLRITTQRDRSVRGPVLATSDRPAIAMCICTAALSPVLRASTTKKINISCEQHIFFS